MNRIVIRAITFVTLSWAALLSNRAHAENMAALQTMPGPTKSEFETRWLGDEITWTDETGHPHKLADFKSSLVVLTMIYTECKKTCPMVTTAKLKELQAALDTQNKSAQFVVVTLDPENDTPEVLAQFKKKIGMDRDNWHFLRGTTKETHQFARKLDLDDYWKMDEHILHKFKIIYLDFQTSHRRTLDWDHRDIAKLLE